MSLVSLRHLDEITLSVDMSKIDATIQQHLGLTAARRAGFEGDIHEDEMDGLPVTIGDTTYTCDCPVVLINNIFQVDTLICWFQLPGRSTHYTDPKIFFIFGLNKEDFKDVWHISPLVIKVESSQSKDIDDALDDFFKLKRSEQLAMLGL